MNRNFCFGRVLSNCRCFNCAGVARLGRDLANLRASQFGNNKLMVMSLVRFMVYLAEGVGNAPRSAAYRAAALLLSYRTRKVNRETP